MAFWKNKKIRLADYPEIPGQYAQTAERASYHAQDFENWLMKPGNGFLAVLNDALTKYPDDLDLVRQEIQSQIDIHAERESFDSFMAENGEALAKQVFREYGKAGSDEERAIQVDMAGEMFNDAYEAGEANERAAMSRAGMIVPRRSEKSASYALGLTRAQQEADRMERRAGEEARRSALPQFLAAGEMPADRRRIITGLRGEQADLTMMESEGVGAITGMSHSARDSALGLYDSANAAHGTVHDAQLAKMDYENKKRLFEAKQKSSKWGGIGKVVGAVGGFIVGGPAGAAVGAQLGGGVGNIADGDWDAAGDSFAGGLSDFGDVDWKMPGGGRPPSGRDAYTPSSEVLARSRTANPGQIVGYRRPPRRIVPRGYHPDRM